MAYPTWKFPTNVQRHDPLENIVKCGSKRGRSSISEWGRIEFWVVAMHVIVLQSIEEENQWIKILTTLNRNKRGMGNNVRHRKQKDLIRDRNRGLKKLYLFIQEEVLNNLGCMNIQDMSQHIIHGLSTDLKGTKISNLPLVPTMFL